MIDQYILQLSNADPVIRRQAIIALGKSGDERALRPLANVIKTDPDPVLRELALRAGRHIRGLQGDAKLQSMAPAPSAPPPASPFVQSASPFVEGPVQQPVEQPAAEAPAETKPQHSFASIQPDQASSSVMVETTPAFTFAEVAAEPAAPLHKQPSKQDQELAKGRLEAAITYKLHGNTDKALESLVDAVRLDPDMASEAVALNLAANLTGISSPQEAIAEITRQAQMPRVKRKSAGTAGGGAVDLALFDTLLQFVILLVVTIVASFVLNYLAGRWFADVIKNTPSTRPIPNPFAGMNTGRLLVMSAASALGTTLNMAIGDIVIYAVGTFLGGVGALFRVIKALARVQTVLTVILGVILAFFLLVAPVTFSRIAELWSFVGLVGLFVLFGVLGGLIALASAVARTHEVSFLRGAGIVVVGFITQGFLFYVLGLLLYSGQFQTLR